MHFIKKIPHVFTVFTLEKFLETQKGNKLNSSISHWNLACANNEKAWLQKRVEAKAREAIPHFPNSGSAKAHFPIFGRG